MKILQTKFTYTLLIAILFNFSCGKEEALEPAKESRSETAHLRVGATNPSVKLSTGNYIIISASNELPANLEQQVSSAKGTLKARMQGVGLAIASSSDPDFAAKAAKIAGVRSVIRDLTIQWYDPEKEKINAVSEAVGYPPNSGDNDPLFDLQWGHTAIDAPKAWNAGYRGKGVRVAVLDSGFDLDHPDLVPNIDIAASASFVPGESLQYALPDVGSHGTHVAGTIAAADNGLGVIGVAPEAQLILVKVLRDSGSGSFGWLLQGIVHAVSKGADVINMSLGTSIPRNGKFLDEDGNVVSETKAVQELIVAINRVTTYAYQNGATLISSAGNDANNGDKDKSLVSIPSDAPHVISISATGPIGWAKNFTANLDRPASYTNFGTSVIDFAAPGGDFAYPGNENCVVAGITRPCWVFDMVLSTGNDVSGRGNWYWSAGTSMASPHAAGVAALIVGKNGGQMNPSHVESVLRASADDLGKPGKDPYYGHGRINAYRAVMDAQ